MADYEPRELRKCWLCEREIGPQTDMRLWQNYICSRCAKVLRGVINLMSHAIEFLLNLTTMVWVDKTEVAEMSSDEITCLVVREHTSRSRTFRRILDYAA